MAAVAGRWGAGGRTGSSEAVYCAKTDLSASWSRILRRVRSKNKVINQDFRFS